MKEQLEQIRREALAAMDAAADSQALETLRVKYLGKKGELTAVLKMMGKLSAEERPVMGQVANAVRADIEEKLLAISFIISTIYSVTSATSVSSEPPSSHSTKIRRTGPPMLLNPQIHSDRRCTI